jgi:hypothetical protein
MDDRVSHFFLTVGRLCEYACTGKFVVRLRLSGGDEVVGVPEPLRETEGADELDTTGYADGVTIAGVAVALSDVVEASVARPDGRRPAG